MWALPWSCSSVCLAAGLSNLYASLNSAVVVSYLHACLYTLHTLSLKYHLVFPCKCKNIDLHTQILIYNLQPLNKHNTEMYRIYSTRANIISSFMDYSIIWLCAVISAEIKGRKGVLFLNNTPIHGIQKLWSLSSDHFLCCFHCAFNICLWINESFPNQQRRFNCGSPRKVTVELNGKMKVKFEKSTIFSFSAFLILKPQWNKLYNFYF